MREDRYDPYAAGPHRVGMGEFEAHDPERDRLFPCDAWFAADVDGAQPLVVFSHSSSPIGRRQSTFLCAHLASHGYVVAAMDHSEIVAPELMGKDGETFAERAARIQRWIDNRVPDVRFLLDRILGAAPVAGLPPLDAARVGIVGHSFGGWTALATPESDDRIRVVGALAPAGSSRPPPNIIPATLTFEWRRDVPTLYLVAENDSALPMDGMRELFDRTRSAKRMEILAGADHGHFFDEFEWRPGQCSKEEAHRLVRGLTLAHLDATLRALPGAVKFWQARVRN